MVATFALAIVVALGCLGGAYLLSKLDHDWTSVAAVNGHSISREALRGRIAVLGLLAQERVGFIDNSVTAGTLPSEQATALKTAAQAPLSLEAARESLVDDELLRQLAARDGVATPPSPDPWVEATTYASGDLAHPLRYVRFGLPAGSPGATTPTGTTTPGSTASPAVSPTPSAQLGASSALWPAASAANVDATAARVKTELAADTPVKAIVAALHDAGWQVSGEDVAVSSAGVPADSSLDLDPTIAASTTRGKPGDLIGPATDAYGRISLGKLLAAMNSATISQRLPFYADKAGVDTSALQSWADGQALRRAVTASLLAGWRAGGVTQAHFRELVVGPAPDSSGTAGPWVELSVLVANRLSGVSAGSITGAPAGLDLGADALAKMLKATSPTDRSSLFRTLVAAANGAPGFNTTNTSGELGFYTKDGVVPDLGKAAFDATARSGDVIGPISTGAGPELFLLEARYGGTLDERSQVALRQVRSDPAADPVAYTRQFSPGDVALATDAGWRAEPEFGSTEAVRAALFDTPIGVLSDPFVLDGKLALALVTERRIGVPDASMLDRLTLDGYDAWFASESAKATITRSDNPLPELMPSQSPSPTTSAAPELPSAPALDTPNLPVIPGQAAPTPVQTDAMGLPALP